MSYPFRTYRRKYQSDAREDLTVKTSRGSSSMVWRSKAAPLEYRPLAGSHMVASDHSRAG